MELQYEQRLRCKKIACYMHASACRWPIVKKAKISLF